MAPKKRLSEMEREQQLYQKASLVRMQRKRREVIQWLQERPDLLEGVHSNLAAHFAKVGSGAADSAVEEGSMAAGSTDGTPVKTEGGSGIRRTSSVDSLASIAEDSPALKLEDDLPASYTRLIAFSVSHLKGILQQLDPLHLNFFALRALVIRGKREAAKHSLSEIITHCTGISSTMQIDYTKFGSLQQSLKHMYDQNDRRASKLCLPPNWDEPQKPDFTGCFQVEVKSDTDMRSGENEPACFVCVSGPRRARGENPWWLGSRITCGEV